MNLASLWLHEKSRLHAVIEETRPHPHAHDHESTTHGKRKITLAAKRELIFRKLVDECTVPLSETTQYLVGCNEFAMEYADRAPKRFIAPTSPPAHSTVPLVIESEVSKVTSRSTRKGETVSPHRRSTTSSQPSTPLNTKGRRKRPTSDLSNHALRPYIGDMFSTRGDYVEGMLYMSRMTRSVGAEYGVLQPRSALKNAVSDALMAAVAASTSGHLHVHARHQSISNTTGMPSQSMKTEISREEQTQLKQRQRCSLTLSNWSSNEENARLMVQENVVEALVLLCHHGDDLLTRLHCVTTLMNLSRVEALRPILVQQGAIKTITSIVSETEDKELRRASAITLCHLCCLEGEEAQLVEQGIVSALSLLLNEHPSVASHCLDALFNLTCVTEPYPKIESVLKVFLTLASNHTTSTTSTSSSPVHRHQVIAQAVCNLSNFKRVRLRLLEEGIIPAITSLLHPTDVPPPLYLLAYILLNLSAIRSCRSEMVAKGCMNALLLLVKAIKSSHGIHQVETKHFIALTMFHLSKEQGNRVRMVFEGFLNLIQQVVDEQAPEIASICARTVYNVTMTEETRSKLVERDVVAVLSSLSLQSHQGDGKKLCTLALCNLLSVQQAATDIVNAGAITALLQLCMMKGETVETRHLFSKALYGLCELPSTRQAVVEAGVIPALLQLCQEESTNTGLVSEIRARCTAALACLAGDSMSANAVSTVDVVRCVVHILVLERFNIAIERFCCACLSLLCRDEQCAVVVAEEGAIQAILSTSLESHDIETKASCCYVVASMSCHSRCALSLVQLNVLSVLTTLAGLKGDATIQRCCAITLANVTAVPAIRSLLATTGIIPLLSLLSNSYSEDAQRDCAKVLCNLSCLSGLETSLVHDGAIAVLMMISMVRAVEPMTKETCVRAFANLLVSIDPSDSSVINAFVRDGLIKVLPTLSMLSLPTSMELISVLYAKLIHNHIGRKALCMERAALRALFQLMERQSENPNPDNVNGERLHVHLLTVLVHDARLREFCVSAGIVEALHKLALHATASERKLKLALILFMLANDETTRLAVASSSSLETLQTFLVLEKSDIPIAIESVEVSVATLASLAWFEDTRSHLHEPELTTALTLLLHSSSRRDSSPPKAVIKTCLLTLCCLSPSEALLKTMLSDHILDHLGEMLSVHETLLADDEIVALTCILLRQLSHIPTFLPLVARSLGSPHHSKGVLHLVCILAVAVKKDQQAGLDVSDAICGIAFLPTVVTSTGDPLPMLRRQSNLNVRVTATSIPSSLLVTANMLEAIDLLLSEDHLPDTRWRCVASLYVLSCIAEYRTTLVRLGCTRMLVGEAYRSEKAFHTPCGTTHERILVCCAGTLCNLASTDSNAAAMIQDGAVPALLHLAKMEHEEIREHCTSALSNLSSQSPKVESGAVSALLSFSLSQRPKSSSREDLNVIPHVPRPPFVCNDRYKSISRLPTFTLSLESQDEWLVKKYEAERHVSPPPPPQLPTISAEVEMICRSSVDEPISNEATQAHHEHHDGWSILSFPKVDPMQSHELVEEDETVEEEEHSSPPTPRANDSISVAQPLEAPNSEEEVRTKASINLKASKSSGTLSPLARVVVRRTQTVNVVNKFKNARSAGRFTLSSLGGPLSASAPSLTTEESLPTQIAPLLEEQAQPDVQATQSVAAAAAAALLYSSPPVESAKVAKSSKKAKPVEKKKKTVPSHIENVQNRIAEVPQLDKISNEDVQAQAKRFGLWN